MVRFQHSRQPPRPLSGACSPDGVPASPGPGRRYRGPCTSGHPQCHVNQECHGRHVPPTLSNTPANDAKPSALVWCGGTVWCGVVVWFVLVSCDLVWFCLRVSGLSDWELVWLGLTRSNEVCYTRRLFWSTVVCWTHTIGLEPPHGVSTGNIHLCCYWTHTIGLGPTHGL